MSNGGWSGNAPPPVNEDAEAAQDIAWDYQLGKTLGPFDRTLDYNMTAFVPLDNMGGAQKPKTWDSPFAGTNNHCGMAAYDLGYLRVVS